MGNPLRASNVLLPNIVARSVPQVCLCREALVSAALSTSLTENQQRMHG